MRNPKILLALASMLLIQSVSATQVNPQLINPQIGENLWGMNYRQSITQDDILNTVTLCCNCDFFITQDDINANGGGFTISQPGNWCLAQDIITSAPINITGLSNTTFDLKGRTISSVVNGLSTPAIISVINSPGTIIKNGNIEGLNLGGAAEQRAGIIFATSQGSVVDGVAVAFFASVDNPAIIKQNFAFYADQSYTEFKNCSASGPFLSGGFFVTGNNSILRNCEVNHFNGSQVSTPGTIVGIGYSISGNNNYLEYCTSLGGDAQPTGASAGSVGFYFGGNNNIAFNCTALNHALDANTPSGIPGGSGFYVIGNNCEIRNCISGYNALYGIFNSGTGLVVCNNSVHNNGTNLLGAPESNLCSLVQAGCDFMIYQADIGTGGTYIITQPGKYCLAETVTYANSSAITINSSDVVLECNQHPMIRTTLNGSPDLGGAIVCNGTYCTIENANIDSDTIVLTNTGTTIRNCKMYGNAFPVASIRIETGADYCSAINCEITYGGIDGIFISANGTLIDGCTIAGSGLSGIVINTGNKHVVQNCLLKNNLAGLTTSSSVGGASLSSGGVLVQNCTAESNITNGFTIAGAVPQSNFVNVILNKCKALSNGVYGIVFGTTNALKAQYVAIDEYVITLEYNIHAYNCIATGNGSNMYMILDIATGTGGTPYTNTSRILSPPAGIVGSFVGQLTWDQTADSSDFNAPVSPAIGANVVDTP